MVNLYSAMFNEDEIAFEAETGKIYRSSYMDRLGRTVLVMRPSCQNSKSTRAQIKYLVYCMENAILNLPQGQEQMVWLIDFHGFNMSHISVKVTKETAHVLQEHYPERLGVAILYNPPKFFEPFWKVVKPFLEPKTANKVKFVYSDDPNSKKIIEELFDMNQIESAFGGNDIRGFDINKFAERMREDDKRMASFWSRAIDTTAASQPDATTSSSLNATILESDSDASEEKTEKSSSQEDDVEEFPVDDNVPASISCSKGANDEK
ncbi:hypothetical protein RJ639_010736 [Escallonia herrerae]|uniref:CRAL-TRIO domain-containing protein n=1 Tax=Escallonia herrerae TaxID=1293975 RepID=A0AA88VL98_9ASTE|nr:hypothetical protein RJ639_010736 [Escallonia herrerae]